MNKNQVSLSISGVNYSGWLDVAVSTGLESITRSFTVSISTKTVKIDDHSWDVDIGDSVEVRIGKDLVLSGYVTKITEKCTGSTHQITLEGKSKTVDLVECSVPDVKSLSYKRISVSQIIRDLASHYGIGLVEEVVKTDVVNFDVSAEETIKEALERLLKKYNVLLTDNAQGDLVITSPGSGKVSFDRLTVGKNVLSMERTRTASPLFCRYVVLGQGANPMSERPLSDNQLKCVAENSGIRLRVCTRVQSGNTTQAELQSRATALKSVSKAEANALSYTVQGWRQTNDDLWSVNSFVLVDDPILKIKSQYLISSVTYVMSSKGLLTEIKLTKPDKYQAASVPSTQEVVKEDALISIGSTSKVGWTSK